LASGQWVTRQQAAALENTSIDTIKRAIRIALEEGRTLEWRVGAKKAKFFFLRHLIALDIVSAAAVAPGSNGKDAAELAQARDHVSRLREQLAEATGRLAVKDEHIATLSKQVEHKDRLLATLARTNESLASRRPGPDQP
jgi:hypothetical protein